MRNSFNEKFKMHEYLYHYTTVENLFFILINKTLKFNKVDQFNDVSESIRNKYVKFFASCHSYSNEESIPLWHIYANMGNGVRIKFLNNDIFGQDLNFYNKADNKITVKVSSLSGILYGQVEYSDEQASKSPSEGSDSIRLTNVYYAACQKRKVWSYEEELRYFIVDDTNQIKEAKCLYVSLNDNFFNNLVITYNPFMEKYKQQLINEAVRALGYEHIKFEESMLKETIRY